MNQVVTPPPASIDRCWQLLQRWRGELKLTRREQGVLAGSLVVLDRQLERLSNVVCASPSSAVLVLANPA